MSLGLSTRKRCDAAAADLLSAGRRFVVRYHSRTTQLPEKRLTPQEAAALARAGLDIATVYQDTARSVADFGEPRGRQDGLAAFVYAGQVGQPPGSAIYFAVDADFSAAQLRSAVLPYFRGVASAFAQAAPAGDVHRIGVYGSGLACALLSDALPAVACTWLAESAGWRGSRDYAAWNLKQHVNTGEVLAALDTAWEGCESTDDFGQFRPVGYALGAGQGEPMVVTANVLNLRIAPTPLAAPPLAQLSQQQIVRVLGVSAPGWVRVRVALNGGDVIGHVNAKYLALPDADSQTIDRAQPATLPAAHLAENSASSRRDATSGRASPIGEAARPTRDANADANARREELRTLADWLDVERSARYRRDVVTYCNVYAADYVYLAGAYLPRVWWTESALLKIATGTVPPVAYGQTVREMRADDLHAWLIEHGAGFGWRRVFDATALQRAANDGGIGIVCADRDASGKPGHITVVVPEYDGHAAGRDADGNVTEPLQSQAGAVNRRYGSAGPSWWRDAQFRSYVMFVHD